MAEENLGSLEDVYVKQENGKKALAVTGGGQALDVLEQDNFSRSGDIHLLNYLNDITLAAATVVGEYTVTLEAGHSVVAGDYLVIYEGTVYFQTRVVSVATNVITMAIPFFYAFSTAATGTRNSVEIETADGSTDPVIFEVGPPPGQKWDIYGITFTARDASDMDDAKFVGATALTRGMAFARCTNGVPETRFLIRSNSEMKLVGNLEYSDKAPAGEYGLVFRKDFRSQNGVAIRLDGDLGCVIRLLIQDDLTVLTYGRAMVAGHIVED